VGLALVAKFAELHDGRAWVQERGGGGASFRVLLAFEPRPEDLLVLPEDDPQATGRRLSGSLLRDVVIGLLRRQPGVDEDEAYAWLSSGEESVPAA
jgi:hypothetical protein